MVNIRIKIRRNQLPVSAASWLHRSQNMGCKSYIVDNNDIAIILTTTEAAEKISADLKSSTFYKFVYFCLTKFKNNKILTIKLDTNFL